LNEIQLYEGINPTLNYNEPFNYTSQIIFDPDNSRYNVNGVLTNKEKRPTMINKINLDSILQLLPLATSLNLSGVAVPATFFGAYGFEISTLDNLELWIVYADLNRVDYGSGNYRYEALINFASVKSNYSLLGYNFFGIDTGDVPMALLDANGKSTYIALAGQKINNNGILKIISTVYGDSSTSNYGYHICGFMLMRRTS
jgi:hypothetical protein